MIEHRLFAIGQAIPPTIAEVAMPRARRVKSLFPIALSPSALAETISIASARVYKVIRNRLNPF